MKPPAIQAVSSSLISRDTVAINYAASDSIAVLAAGIARVALDGINCSVLDTLYNSDCVRRSAKSARPAKLSSGSA